MDKKISEIESLMNSDTNQFYQQIKKIKVQESASVETCIICYNAQISIFAEPLPCGHVFH